MQNVQFNQPATEPFHGRILDTDGHMYMLPEVMQEVVGEVGGGPIQDFLTRYCASAEFPAARARNRAELWQTKGIGALGAYDAAERVEALDALGMKAQFLFSNTFSAELRIDSDAARRVCARYNDYALDFSRRTAGRARAACQINMADRAWAMAELARVIKAGARCVVLPCNEPPGGVSPAHEDWDPFWAQLEEADVPAVLHLGGAGVLACRQPPDLMFPSTAWGEARTLRNKPAERAGGEEAISPYFMLVAHVAPEIYLQTMVMGKVFERFPRLRFAIIEFGTTWVGPACERMDLWANFMNRVGVRYDMKPSEYVRRNVRVAPFWHEDLPRMIDRYGLKEIYCFGTDYPHFEGGKDPIRRFRGYIDEIDPAWDRAFFIDNARWLFPDVAA
ncbi:MAG: amidohydrolase family protein [Gammaproteobacteria bacterium]